jgi:tRNA(Arg) A34 adenosine deaminase TadA
MALYKWNPDTEEFELIAPARSRNDATEENANFKDVTKVAIGLKNRDVVYIPKGSQSAFQAWARLKAAGEDAVAEEADEEPVVVESAWELSWNSLLAGLALGRSDGDAAIAFIWNPTTHKVVGVGVHVGEASDTWQTAIVNVLQQVDAKGLWCVSSYPPSKMCKGMAQVSGAKLLWVEETRALLGAVSLSVRTDQVASLTGKVTLATVADTDKIDPLANPAGFLAKVTSLGDDKLTATVASTVKTFNALKATDERVQPEEQVYDAFKTVPASDAADVTMADHLYTCLAVALVGMTWSPKPTGAGDSAGQKACGNNVAAVLVHNRKIIGWGLNVMTQHRTFHAETVAIQVYLNGSGRTKLPRGCRIYSSLQPCKMCAGFIAHVGDQARVIYALQDRNLATVLSGNADGAGNTAALYSGIWLRALLLELSTAITGRFTLQSGGTTSVMFDRRIDAGYEEALTLPDRLSAPLALELGGLRTARQVRRLPQPEFNRLRYLEQVEADAPAVRTQRDTRGALGLKFANFASVLTNVTKEKLKAESERGHTPAAIAVAEQCLDVLWVAAQTGMSTRYGLETVNSLITRAAL